VSWCEKKYGPQYMTIECLEDGTEVNIYNKSTTLINAAAFELIDAAMLYSGYLYAFGECTSLTDAPLLTSI